jgi:hypothetical protein
MTLSSNQSGGRENKMQLDHQLIYQARHLTNGANVHHLEGLIYAYELAVDLHNRRWPEFEQYPEKYERSLRSYLKKQQWQATAFQAA